MAAAKLPSKFWKRAPLIFAGLVTYSTAAYASFHYLKLKRTPMPESTEVSAQPVYKQVYNEKAEGYDSSIATDETLMGLNVMRRFLMSHATGNVMEMSAGTGRNLSYYSLSKIKSLLLIDQSTPMLKSAFQKLDDNMKKVTTFMTKDAEELDFKPSFDTVVQTFGLCSCADPVKQLQNMQRSCKPDGKILLLEHGRSHYKWLNEALDKTSPDHAKNWGCWWNRDISKLLDESGLQIEYMKRWHFGTTYYIIAKPNPSVYHNVSACADSMNSRSSESNESSCGHTH